MMGAEYTFNSDDGYFEGLVRGFRAGIITQEDYTNLTQCETLEGIKPPHLFYFSLPIFPAMQTAPFPAPAITVIFTAYGICIA